MKPIRIYRHDESVGPGYFLDYLRQHGIKHELIAIDQGDAVTDDFNNLVYKMTQTQLENSQYTVSIDTPAGDDQDLAYMDIPDINLTYPENSTYYGPVTDLKYTVFDSNPGKCW